MITGRDNAIRFVSTILADDSDIITKYGDRWPWMCNKEWRNYVLDKLNPAIFRTARFNAPDHLDDWTFVAYKKTAKLPISHRSLDDNAL